ncbi:helix-turn-helix domain-containing protein [Cyclobacterium jeungdonense]|uniref:Helix-turn-helix domain-containing protein n=1 Tax=Cyclobacterium jeungdonense TaxID=708087 RepID=A0ABT8CC45_9BACT|nr:helix-turn-helix domain-containing protein [Cyclobacterium jeungdonense]MDN3689652.1 helix-turn-helix domain-containing protein [Cyclobacterium jeungdonense]
MEKPIIVFPITIDKFRGIIRSEVMAAIESLSDKEKVKSETLLTRKETADKLKISLVTLNEWTKRGIIQSYLIGGRVLYKESEIDASLHKTQTVKF